MSYSQISLNCYAVGDSHTGQKHSKIIDFSVGFREAFSLLPFCLWGFIWSNTVELGGSEKKFVIPMRVNTLMRVSVVLWAIYAKERGAFRYTPNCYNVWTESFKTIPTDFLLSPLSAPLKNIPNPIISLYSHRAPSSWRNWVLLLWIK